MRYQATRTLDKVQYATVAAGVGGALSEIIVWVLGLYAVEVPPGVQMAMAAVLAAVLTFAAGYLTPIKPGEVVRVPEEGL